MPRNDRLSTRRRDEFDGGSAAVTALIEQSHTWSSFINNANGIPASRCQNVRM